METKFLLLSKESDLSLPTEHQTNEHIEELLQRAEHQAQQIVSDAQESMEKQKQIAEQQFEEWKRIEQEKLLVEMEEIKKVSFNQGYEDGAQHAQQEFCSKIDLAKEVIEQAYEEKKEIIREAEPFVIDLSIQIAEKIIKKELETEPNLLIEMIKQNLLYSNERSMITICVSPDDFDFVQNQRNQLLESIEGQVEVKIVPEHSIEKGGCVVRTSYGSIDARIDVQLKEIKQALFRTLQEDTYNENAGN